MNFLWCTLRVKDLEESLYFYEKIVGIPLITRFQAGPGMEIAFLGSGETKIELISDTNTKVVEIGTHISIGFSVESLDEKIQYLKEHNIQLISDIIRPNPTTRFFYVLDPNGLRVQFVEQAI